MPWHPSLPADDTHTVISRRIAALRFPLVCAVVLIHSSFDAHALLPAPPTPAWWQWLQLWLCDLLPRGAVPLLTAISGYLFFHNFDGSLSRLGHKLSARARTLALPYLMWNSVVLTVFLVGLALPGTARYFGGHGAAIAQAGPWEHAQWLLGLSSYPPAFQFWFIRNLIVACLLSPLLYFALRRAGLLFCLGLTACWIGGCDPLPHWHLPYTLTFFCWGALLQLRLVDLTAADHSLLPALSGLILLSLLALYLLESPTISPHAPPTCLVRLLGCATLWFLCGWLQRHAAKTIRLLAKLSTYSFFLFAVHEPLLRITLRTLHAGWPATPPLLHALLSLLTTASLVALVTSLAHLLAHHLPTLFGLLSGQTTAAGRPPG